MNEPARLIRRREALRTAMRLGGLGGVVALVAGVRWRNGACARTSPCERCPVFSECGLSKAEQARSAAKTEVNHG